jgi:uncharacterized membrane protein
MSTPTPRTDFATDLSGWVTAGFARTLERELAALLKERDELKGALALGQQNCDAEYDCLREERDEALKDLAAALTENAEQARLLGMSAERECALRGKVERLEAELAALRESYAYAEISLPDELIPARKEAK